MDPFKRLAQAAAKETAGNINRLNKGEFRGFEASRGESAYLIEAAKSYLAHVEEGLGTKNLVADQMFVYTNKSYYDQIAQDTVAMIVNDLITVGALPLSVAMHLAVGDSKWFENQARFTDLIRGWKTACDLAGCVWGGGETPTLKNIIIPETVVLSGSAIGIVKPKSHLISGQELQPGDKMVFVASSGIHANGLTLARKIANKLPSGLLAKLSNGRTLGETLLDPTHIYVALMEACFKCGIRINYTANVTGHGWRKLMRAPQTLTYVVDNLPPQLPVFDFIQKMGPVTVEEMYGTFNMGVGFVLYVPEEDASKVVEISRTIGFPALIAGHIEAGEKKVVIKPVKTKEFPDGLTFLGESLAIR